MSFVRAVLGGLLGVVACGPVEGPDEPLEEGSTGEAEDTTAADTTEGEGSGDAADESSTRGVLDAWCLRSHELEVWPEIESSGFITHADVNGDGHPELWIKTGGEESTLYSVGLDDEGDFGAVRNHGDWPLDTVGDVDGDGHADGVKFGVLGSPSAWYAGQASGTFAGESIPLASSGGSWAQLDDDGIVDRIRELGWGDYVVDLGVGNGTFTELAPLALTSSSRADPLPVRGMPGRFGVMVDDGGVGVPDRFVQVYGFDAEGELWLAGTTGIGGEPPWGMFDVDGDGIVDVVYESPLSGNRGLVLARGHSDGTFESELIVPAEDMLHGGVGDFDGDGYVDLLWTVEGEFTIWLARGAEGGLEAPEEVRGNASVLDVPIAPADYDGDGRDSWVVETGPGADVHEVVPCAG